MEAAAESVLMADTPREIDYRIKQLSYSSLTTLHSCPRKYQLYKLGSDRAENDMAEKITFGFGHAVGSAIQWLYEGMSLEDVIFKMFTLWPEDIFQVDSKRKKSLWEAIIAAERFSFLLSVGFLSEYELVYVDGKPATELSFCITFPDGFRFRGYLDAVLRRKADGKIFVLENKTTAATPTPAMWINSSQALGYSVVLDVLFPELNAYEVIYNVYQTKEREFSLMSFPKNYLQRAKWIQDLLLDIEIIKMYEDVGDYPMRGESCNDYFKPCKYIDNCGMSTQYLVKPFNEDRDTDTFEYQINLTMDDLIRAQLAKQ